MYWTCYTGLCFIDEHTSEGVQCVMVCVLPSSVVDCGFESNWNKSKTLKLVFSASPLITQHHEEFTDILEIRVMCQSGTTSLLAD